MLKILLSKSGRYRVGGGLLLVAMSMTACGCIGSGKAQDHAGGPSAGHSGQQVHPVQGVEKKRYVPDEVIIQFKNKTDFATIAAIQQEVGLDIIRQLHGSGLLYLMKIRNSAGVIQTVEKLERYNSVDYAEPNYIVRVRRK